MRSLAILVIISLLGSNSFSQSLAGEWRGSFIGEGIYKKPTPFALRFTLNKDSTYKVYSYTQTWSPGLMVAVDLVSEVDYRIITADSIYLEEGKQVKPDGMEGCSQKFFLTLKKKKGKWTLEGSWSMVDPLNCGKETGTVLLTKN